MYSFLRFLDFGWHGEEVGRHKPADLPIIFVVRKTSLLSGLEIEQDEKF
jgi:hypothetical protein